VFGGEPLSEKELNRIFAVPVTHPMFRAILELIDDAEADANEKAAEEPHNREMHVGTAAQMRLLKGEVVRRRENAVKLFPQ
jgi:hypothetical protein